MILLVSNKGFDPCLILRHIIKLSVTALRLNGSGATAFLDGSICAVSLVVLISCWNLKSGKDVRLVDILPPKTINYMKEKSSM